MRKSKLNSGTRDASTSWTTNRTARNAATDPYRIGLTGNRKLPLKPFEFDNQNGSPPDDCLLGGRGVGLVAEVTGEDVFAAANPRGATVHTGQERRTVRDPALLRVLPVSDRKVIKG